MQMQVKMSSVARLVLIGRTQALGRSRSQSQRLWKVSTSSVATQAEMTHSSSSSQGQDLLQPLGKWDLYAGVVLERKPIITQEMTPLETEYSQLLAKYEFELSKKSNHEIRKQKDKILVEKIKSGEIEGDAASAVTAQDEEDLWISELNQFKPASRQTDADKKKDNKSLNRALDSHLLLLIEQKLGQDYKWICPQGRLQTGETMRQTAERVLGEACPEVKSKMLGNAPWGVYKYKYPKRIVNDQKLESIGAKIFFFKAQLISGDIKKSKEKTGSLEFKDHLWLTRDEISSKLHPEYHKHLCELLIDEPN